MRESKYQVYDHKLKMMFGVTELSQLDNGSGFVKGRKGDSGGEYYVTTGYLDKKMGLSDGKQIHRFNLRQYAGLKDKNGKEIYGGDLLLIAISSYSTGDVIAQKIVPVEYRVCKFGVPWSDEFTALDGFSNTTFEVIGNIHEHPHLLQQPTG